MASFWLLACLVAVLTVIPQPASGQPNQPPAESTSWNCDKWYSHLAKALVADEEIIHRLQDTFFPISGRAPFILVMEYDVLYFSNGTVEVKNVVQGWSSSVVLSAVHPVLLLHWQPWLQAIFLLQGMINYTRVAIPLIIAEEIGESPPDLELKCAVKKLTSWVSGREELSTDHVCSLVPPSSLQLRAYAEYQGKPQRWDVHSKGFIWEEDGTSITDVLVVVATLALQILLQLYLKRHFIDIVSQCLEQDTPWRLCVWSAGEDFLLLGLLLLIPDGATLLRLVSSEVFLLQC